MNKTGRDTKISKLLSFFLLLVVAQVYGQLYPVSVNVNMVPPYSVRLSEYTTSIRERMYVDLSLFDVNDLNRKVRLKLIIKRNNQVIGASRDFVAGAPDITLDGGLPLTLTNLDLAAYFRLENLQGIAPQVYSNPLPDGYYQFCFEVYDFLTGRLLSNTGGGCANVRLVLYDPPLLNLPREGDIVSAELPQNIFFTWTPRGIPPSGVEYEFTLKELWDTQIDPRAAFQASPELYRTTIFDRSLLYDQIAPQLIDGKTYGWQVRAFVSDGIEETALFKNNGYSEIFWFTYLSDCNPPDFILAEAISTNSERITWNPNFDHLNYRVQYRKVAYKEETEKERQRREKRNIRRAEKGKDPIEFDPEREDYEWYEVNTRNPFATIHNLEAGTTYEYRVGGQCHFGGGFSYSDPQEFTTATKGETTYYNCGLTPEVTIENRDPLQNLGVNETFTAGDFPVTVKEVRGANGRYSGWGFIVVPYLADTKIRVTFNDVQINTDYQLIQGEVETAYDEDWNNAYDIDSEIAAVKELAEAIKEKIEELAGGGELGQGEKEAILSTVGEQVSIVEGAEEKIKAAQEELKEAEASGDEKGKEEAQKKIEMESQTVADTKKAMENKAKELGVGVQDGDHQEDSKGFFDGYLPISSTNGELLVNRLDGNGTLRIPINDSIPNNDRFYEDYTVNVEGTVYTFIYTSSDSSEEDIKKAREKASNPQEGITIYLHYDTQEGRLGYKVEMEREYFGNNLSSEDYERARESFKEGIKNLIKDINEVEDWGALLLEVTESLNKQLKEALTDVQLPEALWNPEDPQYDEPPYHFEPIGAGLMDGIFEEVKDIPLLVSFIVDYSTNEQARNEINQAITDFEFTEAVSNWYEDRKDLYNGPTYIIDHQTGKDIITVVTTVGTGGITSAGKIKDGVDLVKEAVEKVKRAAKKVFKNADELVADIVAKRHNIRKVLDTDIGKSYAKKYFDKIVKKGDFEDWYKNTFKKYDLKNDPLNFEVHHVIPISVLNKSSKLKELLYWVQKNGKQFDFNSIDNGIPLPKKRVKYDISGHASHPKYDDAMTDKIMKITNSKTLGNEDKFNAIKSLIEKTKNRLENEVLMGSKDVNKIIDL